MGKDCKHPMSLRNASVIVLTGVLGAAAWIMSPASRPARAEAAPAKTAAESTASQAALETPAKKDEYQRSTEIYTYTTTAKSGPQRGEELYFIKCWFCHNQFAKTGPQLKDLFKRPTIALSGEPVNDQTVAEKIRKGGPAMPAYGYILKDPDIADLLSYIKEGCCFDSENPPPNPRYRRR